MQTYIEIVSADGTLRAVRCASGYSEETAALVAEYMESRLVFVRDTMRWVSPDVVTDEDEYDRSPETVYLLCSRAGSPSAFLAGIRLTRLSNPETSLTWNMTSAIPDMQATARSHREFGHLVQLGWQGDLWDATRLVPTRHAADEEARALRGGYLTAVGMSFAVAMMGDRHPGVLSLTDARMHDFLVASGIPMNRLAGGGPSPTRSNHLCITYPAVALESSANPDFLAGYDRIASARPLAFDHRPGAPDA